MISRQYKRGNCLRLSEQSRIRVKRLTEPREKGLCKDLMLTGKEHGQ